MKITIDTKWVEAIKDFDTETKVVLYESIFDYMSDKEVKEKYPIIPEGERSEKLLSLDKWMEKKTTYIYKNIRLLTQAEFDALCDKYTSAQICDTLQQIENRKDLRKRYTNLYRTLLNWLKNGTGTSNG